MIESEQGRPTAGAFTSADGARHEVHEVASTGGRRVPGDMVAELRARGWCFVELPGALRGGDIVPLFQSFFAQDEEVKRRYSAPFSYGYSRFDHKEGLRLLTGERLDRMVEWVPPELDARVGSLARSLDQWMMSLTLWLCEPLFGCDPRELARRADLPVGFTHHFGMLDATRYFNERTSPAPPPMGSGVEDVNCVPHYDPGLLSISFLSTAEGLQLQDPATGRWVDGPVNTLPGQEHVGVLWTGAAATQASDGAVRAGVHRVIYPRDRRSRLALWYEMPTIRQVAEPVDEPMYDEEVVIPNLPGGAPMRTLEGEAVFEFLLRVERTRGVPMSKIMRLDDRFKSWW